MKLKKPIFTKDDVENFIFYLLVLVMAVGIIPIEVLAANDTNISTGVGVYKRGRDLQLRKFNMGTNSGRRNKSS